MTALAVTTTTIYHFNERKKMTSYNKRFKNCTFDNFKPETKEQEEAIVYLKDCVVNGFKDNIAIMGGVGTGKTHLAYAIINALETIKDYGYYQMYTNEKVNMTTIKSMIDNIRNTWKKEADNLDHSIVADYSRVPLLIIDEIGVQYGSESERVELFEIFNNRYNDMLPTMILSNLNKEQIGKVLGQRIIDRVFSGSKTFEFVGKSKR